MGMGRFASQVLDLVTRRRGRRGQYPGETVLAHGSSGSSGGSAHEATAADGSGSDPEVAELFKTLAQKRSSRSAEHAADVLSGVCDFRGEPVLVRDVPLHLVPQFGGDAAAAHAALRRAQALSHPNLARVLFATVSADGRLVVVSQRGNGNVRDMIARSCSLRYSETLTQPDALRIALAVCDAAAYLHAQNVTGLRLRPSSVLVFGSGDDAEFKLSDVCLDPLLSGAALAALGAAGSSTVGAPPSNGPALARVFDDTHSHSLPQLPPGAARGGFAAAAAAGRLYGHTFPLGSSVASSFEAEQPEFMSPEELAGAALLGQKSDVFSFGTLLWQLLHLQAPWPSEWGPFRIRNALLGGNRPHVEKHVVGMDSPLRRVLLRCWAADPESRPSFPELAHMLRIAVHMNTAQEARDRQMLPSDLTRQRVHVDSRTVRNSDGSLSVDLEHLARMQGLDGEEEEDDEGDGGVAHAGAAASPAGLRQRGSDGAETADADADTPPAIPPRPAHLRSAMANSRLQQQRQQPRQPAPALAPKPLELPAPRQFGVRDKVLLWDLQVLEYSVGVVRSVDMRRELLQVRFYSRPGEVWVKKECASLLRDEQAALISRDSSSSNHSSGGGSSSCASAGSAAATRRSSARSGGKMAYAA